MLVEIKLCNFNRTGGLICTMLLLISYSNYELSSNFLKQILLIYFFVSRQAVSKWENGDTEPNLDNLIALARILNVSLENLITGSSNPNSLLLTLSHVSKKLF